jgi:hypothetical protein
MYLADASLILVKEQTFWEAKGSFTEILAGNELVEWDYDETLGVYALDILVVSFFYFFHYIN